MQSPIYWHPLLYRTAMRLSYGSQFTHRYTALEKHIPPGGDLFELCFGDAFFYLHYLAKKNITYRCGDINPVFVNAAKRKGLDAKLLDVFFDEIPRCDTILMQASLYHFIPNQKEIIKKLLASAKRQLIIAESVSNMSNSSSGLKAYLGEQLSKAKTGQSRVKFTRKTLKEAFSEFKDNIVSWEDTPGGREVIIVLKPH